jgi:polyribonucleotide nucleotidyltransferase
MNLKNKKEFTLPFHGRELKFIVSDVAGQANSAIIGQYGDTSVLVTTVMGKQDRATDFFPLTVDYEERFYAAGKIIGSRFIRREGRPSDFAVLSGRLIDRSIRPLFDERLRRDVQLVITILSYDEENDPDFLAHVTASLALAISDIPWKGPIGGIRVAFSPTKGFIFNPTNSQVAEMMGEDGAFESFFSGTQNRMNMIELGGKDAGKENLLKAFTESHEQIKKLIDFENEVISKIGKSKTEVALKSPDPALEETVRNFIIPELEKVMYASGKSDRNDALDQLKEELFAHLKEMKVEDLSGVMAIWENAINEVVHKNIMATEKRPDGRKLDELRELYAEAGLFKRLHGSALFTRGETQALAVTTLAAPGSEQIVETMETSLKRRFMLHYNFPPYSTGETGRVGMPGRREIGHGALAKKALEAVIPTQDEFPYTIRVVSEVLSSNGSSSMATACAGCLSLMDAGVPIKKPVAGIAMGLMTYEGYNSGKKDSDFKVLTDIQGPEDHYGDMDLKVAGTKDGVNALQMDVKIEGIVLDVFSKAIDQAQKARLEILEVITKVLAEPRKELSPYAPIIMLTQIKPYQIGMIIGPGGKMINGIIEKYGLVSIDIDDDGKVFVASTNPESARKAIDLIEGMTKEFVIGDIVEGPIIKLLEFGAIVDLGGGRDGMVHISEVKNGFVKTITDVLKQGQMVKAKVVKVDENGKIGLSIKALSNGNPATGD